MVLIFSSPAACALSPAYVPNFYFMYEFTPEGEGVPACEVEIFINGNSRAKIPYNPSRLSNFGGTQTAYYEIDISEVIQSFFNNKLPLLPVASGDAWASPNTVAAYYVQVTSYLPNEGFLMPETVVATSQTNLAINAVRDRNEEQCLDLFLGFPTYALTNKPFPVAVCKNESEFLYIFSGQFRDIVWRFDSYDSEGVLLETGFVNGKSGTYQIHGMGVGPQNIENISWDDGSVTLDSSVSYYTVQAGRYLNNQYFAITPPYRYSLNHSCCPKVRVHFLNKFGVFDSVSIQGEKVEDFRVSSDTFERTLPLYIDTGSVDNFVESHQTSKLYSELTPRLSVSSYGIRRKEAIWLKELPKAALLYLENEGNYIPVTVQDSAQEIKVTGEPYTEISYTFIQDPELSQRN